MLSLAETIYGGVEAYSLAVVACGPGVRPAVSSAMVRRSYAVARRYEPLLVNTVVGFIGPEYLYDGRQILRAALEDHFCGKLLGLPMGLDVCYANHADADDDDIATMLTMLGVAGASFVICTPGSDDIMLNSNPPPSTTRCTSVRSWGCARHRSSRHGWTASACWTNEAGYGPSPAPPTP